ncbi:hypothetical protein [Streptomyces sp. Y7]|uniref:hypothetical protein n=1 Tax=Streptomyces sp. Y7 TaxID=3342392 RepID=UPI0037121F5F
MVEHIGVLAPDSVARMPDYQAAAVHAQSQIRAFLAATGLADEIAEDGVSSRAGERSAQFSDTDWSRCVWMTPY